MYFENRKNKKLGASVENSHAVSQSTTTNYLRDSSSGFKF